MVVRSYVISSHCIHIIYIFINMFSYNDLIHKSLKHKNLVVTKCVIPSSLYFYTQYIYFTVVKCSCYLCVGIVYIDDSFGH
jgi:hypothetical protein